MDANSINSLTIKYNVCLTSSNQRLGKCVWQNSIQTRKRGARQRGPKPLKKPGVAANLQSSHDAISKFPGCTQKPERN